MENREAQKMLIEHPQVDQTEDSMYIIDLIEKRDIKCFVEIGSALGGSAALYSYSLSKDCTVICINLYNRLKPDFHSQIKKNCPEFHYIAGDSHEVEIQEQILELKGEKSIDFLHIDGDHTYDGVKADFYDYFYLVSVGGIIVVHDVHSEEGVSEFWNELVRLGEFKTEQPRILDCIYPNIGIVYREK